ncbi:ATP-binding protein [Streptomyces sp. YIM 98790]|uniref:ATP-binding protein n=1 Tax=Streptomyces sp. YIM 98790 TaxID=2689077 RepID=UPI001FB64548|nr:ATP-binding protein [Streptomyces sp. YIM 98790]
MNDRPHRVELPVPAGTFTMMFSSTRRGARLARLLSVQRLDEWGIPYSSSASQTVALLVSELAANAVRHGHIPGRDFQLALTLDPRRSRDGSAVVRVEVSDARSELRPRLSPPAGSEDEHGRGLLLVEALAGKWGVTERDVGKTVWCEVEVDGAGL